MLVAKNTSSLNATIYGKWLSISRKKAEVEKSKTCFPLNENIENIDHFVVSSIMYNSAGCGEIIQNDNFICVIFKCYYFFLNVNCLKLKKIKP